MKALKVIAWIIGAPIAGLLLLMALGAILKAFDYQPSQASRNQDAIDLCWKEQERKSNSPDQARFIASACERMEERAKGR